MAGRNTVIRSMHDLGLAAWFGGNLMGAVGLNGAAAGAKNPVERLTLSSLGWAKWAPFQVGALVVHGIAGMRLQALNGVTTALDLEAGLMPVERAYARAAAEGRKERLEDVAVYGREGLSPREPGEIGIHALRGGAVVGEESGADVPAVRSEEER